MQRRQQRALGSFGPKKSTTINHSTQQICSPGLQPQICASFAKRSLNEKPLERRVSALVGFISQDLQNTKPNQWQWWGVGYISLGLSSLLPTTLFWATGFFHPSIFEVLNHIESYKKLWKKKVKQLTLHPFAKNLAPVFPFLASE